MQFILGIGFDGSAGTKQVNSLRYCGCYIVRFSIRKVTLEKNSDYFLRKWEDFLNAAN
jgi:hypothetical protein